VSVNNYRTVNYKTLARNFPSFCLYAVLQCPHSSHQTRSHTYFCINVIKVKLNSFLADENFRGNGFVGVTSKDQLENLQFAWGEIG